jgi:hypothetical protein
MLDSPEEKPIVARSAREKLQVHENRRVETKKRTKGVKIDLFAQYHADDDKGQNE